MPVPALGSKFGFQGDNWRFPTGWFFFFFAHCKIISSLPSKQQIKEEEEHVNK